MKKVELLKLHYSDCECDEDVQTYSVLFTL